MQSRTMNCILKKLLLAYPLTFNRCNRHNKNLLQVQKMYFVVSFPRTFLLREENMFTPPTYHLCNFWKAIKMPTCTHTGWFISVPLCSGQSELASIRLFVQFNN